MNKCKQDLFWTARFLTIGTRVTIRYEAVDPPFRLATAATNPLPQPPSGFVPSWAIGSS